MIANRVYALCMHSFNKQIDYLYDLSYTQLETLLDTLLDNNFIFISFEDLLTRNYAGSKNVLVSLDDGRSSILPVYGDILAPRKIQPLLAISTNLTALDLTWGEIKELQKAGCYVASHGHNHIRFTPDASLGCLREELEKSKDILENTLGIPVVSFVYPQARYLPYLFNLVSSAGYTSAFTVANNPIPVEWDTFGNYRYRLPRYDINNSNWDKQINNIIFNSRL